MPHGNLFSLTLKSFTMKTDTKVQPISALQNFSQIKNMLFNIFSNQTAAIAIKLTQLHNLHPHSKHFSIISPYQAHLRQIIVIFVIKMKHILHTIVI